MLGSSSGFVHWEGLDNCLVKLGVVGYHCVTLRETISRVYGRFAYSESKELFLISLTRWGAKPVVLWTYHLKLHGICHTHRALIELISLKSQTPTPAFVLSNFILASTVFGFFRLKKHSRHSNEILSHVA